MALGKKNRFEGKNYSIKLKLKEGDNFLIPPVLEVSEKRGEKYEVLSKETEVNGDLFSIDTSSNETENYGTIRSYTLGLRDVEKNEAYYIQVGLGSSIGRSLANAVLALKAFTNVSISTYSQTAKEGPKKGQKFGAASLRQNDEIVRWKFEKTQVPAIVKAKVGAKEVSDDTEQQEFFLAQLKEFAAVVAANKANLPKGKAPVSTPESHAEAPVAESQVPQGEADDEALPF